MQVFDNFKSLRQRFPHCVATIGKYDGMHLGHQMILQRLKELAQEQSLPSLVILSEPQPEEYFQGVNAPARLLGFSDKVNFLDRIGIDLVYRLNFNRSLSELSAEDFIAEVLHQGLGVKGLVVGDDFHFGKNRSGNFALLQAKSGQYGYSVEAASSCMHDKERVSSTLLRQKLEDGDCAAAARLLGRPYQLRGEVVQGAQLGRELGYPTANIRLEMDKLALEGVFAVTVNLQRPDNWDHSIQGVASVGYKPSIEGDHELAVEVYLFDFSDDIYGATLEINFLKKVRDQEKYASLAQLKEQIRHDVQFVKDFFEQENDLAKLT